MSALDTIRLLEIEPDLGRFMNGADRDVVGDLVVPVVTVPAGELDIHELLSRHRAFATIVVDGMLVRRIVVGESATLRLLGPGDLVGALSGTTSMLITSTGWRAAAPTQMAVLGRDVLVAAHRAPRLVAGLQARGAEQSDRVALQLAICQLPRVEDRVLSMLWLLAESWGQVTAQGTALRMRLTHETLGGLIGARRSTVTLALSQLTDEGAILREDGSWLLIEPPPIFDAPKTVPKLPQLLEPLEVLPPVPPVPLDAEQVVARVRELREVRAELARVRALNERRTAEDLARARELRLRSTELRKQARERRAAGPSVTRFHHEDRAADAVGAAQWEADDAAAEGLPAAVDGVED